MAGIQKGIDKRVGELNANKDIDIGEIEGYAQDVSNYEEDKKEASNDKRNLTENKRHGLKI